MLFIAAVLFFGMARLFLIPRRMHLPAAVAFPQRPPFHDEFVYWLEAR